MVRKGKNPRDDYEIYQLIKKYIFPFAVETDPQAVLTQKDAVKRISRGNIRVIRKQGRIQGFIHFFIIKSTVWVDMLAVAESMRGQGCGQRLMRAAEISGKKKLCGQSKLYVDQANIPAMAFYRRLGYVVDQYIPVVRCFRLKKVLTEI